jgi:hypothetical protein
MDLKEAVNSYAQATTEFLSVANELTESHLDASDSGGWSARQVIHHVADSEAQSYARLRRLIHRADRRASQEKRPGGCAAACDAAQTRPAADAAQAIRPAPAVPAGARIRTPHQQPEGRWADTRQCAWRPPRRQPWAERAAQRRPARPLGPLVIVPQETLIKQTQLGFFWTVKLFNFKRRVKKWKLVWRKFNNGKKVELSATKVFNVKYYVLCNAVLNVNISPT